MISLTEDLSMGACIGMHHQFIPLLEGIDLMVEYDGDPHMVLVEASEQRIVYEDYTLNLGLRYIFEAPPAEMRKFLFMALFLAETKLSSDNGIRPNARCLEYLPDAWEPNLFMDLIGNPILEEERLSVPLMVVLGITKEDEFLAGLRLDYDDVYDILELCAKDKNLSFGTLCKVRYEEYNDA